MTNKRKVLTIAAVVLFGAGPILFYEYSDLLDASHDRARCGAWYADYLKHTKYSNTRNYMTETRYCEQLEFEAWCCRFAGILSMVGGLVCIYFAFRRPAVVNTDVAGE